VSPRHDYSPVANLGRLLSDTIAIEVGSVPIKFFICWKLLYQRSKFFQKAIKDMAVSHSKRSIKLLEQNPEIFGIYVQSLYSMPVLLFESFADGEPPARQDVELLTWPPPEDEEWLRWRNCYILGEFLNDTDFQDASIDGLIRRLVDRGNEPVFGLAHDIYSHSMASSFHRKLVVDLYIKCNTGQRHLFHPETHIPRVCHACKNFGADVLHALGEMDELEFEAYDTWKFVDYIDRCTK
jgi:hypothetical protein